MLTNELGLPEPFVRAATSSHWYKENRYSVTETIGGTCEAILKRRHGNDVEEDVADRVWAIFGTAVHKVIQDAGAGEGQEQEKYVVVKIGDYELSGIFDLYDANKEKVTDWKTCSVWKTQVGDFDDWKKQVGTYCWMIERNGGKARYGEVVAIMRDHSMRDARFKDGYPPHPVMRIEWEFTDDDMEEVGSRVSAWLSDAKEQASRDDDELVPCSPEQRWAKSEKWAVMRGDRKRAVRVFDDEESAVAFIGDDKSLHVERRHGEDTKCQSYCGVARWCPYGKKYLEKS